MKIIIKTILVLLIVLALAAPGLALDKKTALLEKFAFQGREYSLAARFSTPRADLILHGPTSLNLSSGMEGENIFLGNKSGRDTLYTFWLNYCDSTVRLAYYDFQRNRSRVLAVSDFSFIALPEIIETGSDLKGLVFLGNRSKNDDIFYYDLEKELLLPLTATPFSEKGFTLRESDGQLEIETSSLWAQYRYRFDPLLLEVSLVEEDRFAIQRLKAPAAAQPADYYNTYIGFGDSITWGKIEGQQRLDLCYLTQMKTILADTGNASYYGLSDSINRGVPGDRSLEGAKRVVQELAVYKGFYFLLMLGVNDIIYLDFSIASSLENLGFIIDTAKAKNMRVIVSTPTPSKDSFSTYAYYWDNLRNLSTGILALAADKNVASIDARTVFMNTNPPDGYKALLENIIPGISNGNHPNAEGHRIIANLFASVLTAFPPLGPGGVTVLNPKESSHKDVQWDPNYESDFSHFVVEFDFEPAPLSHRLTTIDSHFTFSLFPFLPTLYFRLQAVDRGGRASAFTAVFSAQDSSATSARQLRNK